MRRMVKMRCKVGSRDDALRTVLRPLHEKVALLYDAIAAAVDIPGNGSLLNEVALNVQSKHHGAIAAHRDAGSKCMAATSATSAPRSLTVILGLLWVHALEEGDFQLLDGDMLHAVLKWSEGHGGGDALKCKNGSAYRFSTTFVEKS